MTAHLKFVPKLSIFLALPRFYCPRLFCDKYKDNFSFILSDTEIFDVT
jgi:hypothetical protein